MRLFWLIYYRCKKPTTKSEIMQALARTTGMRLYDCKAGYLELRGMRGTAGYLIPTCPAEVRAPWKVVG